MAELFDESLLEDSQALSQLDRGRLLWSLAGAGAQVRHAMQTLDDFELAPLVGQRPRAVLLAGDAGALGAVRALASLIAPMAPVVVWAGPELPEWAGPLDALLVASAEGRHPRLVSVVGQAERRGLLAAVAAPAESPVAHAAGRSPVAVLDIANPRAALWAVLTPLLLAADALGVASAEASLLEQVAAALDGVAESVRPDADVFANAAKGLAVDLSGSTALVAGVVPLAEVAAWLFAEDLRLLAGSPAVSIGLPDQLATGSALLAGSSPAASAEEFFRDRVESAGILPRLVLIGEDGWADPGPGGRAAEAQLPEAAARGSAAALRDVAAAHGMAVATVDAPPGPALCRFATAVALGGFTAAYLALGRGLDPSEPLGRP